MRMDKPSPGAPVGSWAPSALEWTVGGWEATRQWRRMGTLGTQTNGPLKTGAEPTSS